MITKHRPNRAKQKDKEMKDETETLRKQVAELEKRLTILAPPNNTTSLHNLALTLNVSVNLLAERINKIEKRLEH